jgi:sugar lactone lactonase YvrE
MKYETRELAKAICFGECPRWHDGRLWFSDFFAHAVKSVSLEGDLRTEFEVEDQPSGLGWLPDGSMLIVLMNSRQILRRAANGVFSPHAAIPNAGFRCNDMVVDTSGNAYVGDFGFDLHGEILQRGVESVLADHPLAQITRVTAEGIVRVVAEGLHFPNGTVVTPDGKTLIVAETLAGFLTAFDIESDGSLSHRRVWANLFPRVADGIALDADGNIWVANPLAPECVLIEEGGRVLEIVETELPCFACMLGGPDGRTLFMLTAPTSLEPSPNAPPAGRLLVTTAASPHAGCP